MTCPPLLLPPHCVWCPPRHRQAAPQPQLDTTPSHRWRASDKIRKFCAEEPNSRLTAPGSRGSSWPSTFLFPRHGSRAGEELSHYCPARLPGPAQLSRLGENLSRLKMFDSGGGGAAVAEVVQSRTVESLRGPGESSSGAPARDTDTPPPPMSTKTG